jgi:hypothetical protein
VSATAKRKMEGNGNVANFVLPCTISAAARAIATLPTARP